MKTALIIIAIIFVIIIFFCSIFLFPNILQDHQKDDEKPIQNLSNMQIHCKVVSEGSDFYWITGLKCAVCAYQKECEKYIKRYGKLPNGEKK